ncbi:MAG: site-specific integrase [Kiritimatiellales bacterium]|nr:site-specific integrase [Kiritimatiellales bacterium]
MKAHDKDKNNPERKRGKRGNGRLYKRDSAGKEYSADDDMHGAFWLAYTVNGKRIRQRLLDAAGNSITKRKAAEKERRRILAPLLAADKVEQLSTIKAKLTGAEAVHAQAVDEANPPLLIARSWDAFLTSEDGPDAGADMESRYFGYWKKFNKWLSENRPEFKHLCEITPQTAQDYAASLSAAKISPNTYNKHTGFLCLFFRVLAEPARMQSNPFEKNGKNRFRKKLKSNARRELTIAELKEVLEKATGDLQTLFYIGTFTGLRLGDCCTLKWSEVDLDRGLIRRVPNKTATKRKPVFIGIPSALHAKLSETPAARRKGYVLPKYAALYTYRSPLGNPDKQPEITREIQAHFIDCDIQTIKEGTGPGTGKRAVVEVGFHSLRHTFVSIHSERGTPQAVVQSIVGHGSPAMTAHYSHIGEETARRVAGVLELSEPRADPARAPLPDWARKLIEGMTTKNLKERKKELLAEPNAGGK